MTHGKIFRFWAPLALTWLMMSVEGPLLAAVIARLPEAKVNLAAYGLAYAVALMVESPIINMLTAATALVKDQASYFKLRRFANGLNIAVTVLMLAVGVSPLLPYLTEEVMEVPGDVGRLARLAIIILLPWPAVVGYRRFYQGVLISGGRTRSVALGTVMRVVAMAATAGAAGLWSELSGALTGALALTAGVIVEAVAARVMAGPIIEDLGAEPLEESRGMTLGTLTRFYYPLAVTSILALAVHPMISFLAGLGRMPLESLAVLPVVNSLVFIFRALGLSYQEAAIALMGRRMENEAALRRFAGFLALASSGGLALLAFTPLAGVWYQDISGLSATLSEFAIRPTRILSAMPALTVALVWLRSLLVCGKRTGPITAASSLEVLAICGAMLGGIYILEWTGAAAAAVAYMLGRLLGCAVLAAEKRRFEKRTTAERVGP